MQQRALFIVPPLITVFQHDQDIRGGRDTYRARYPHIGFAYMVSILQQNDVSCKVLDMNLGYSFNQLLDIVKFYVPDFICVTIYSAGYKEVYSLVNSIKKHYGGVIIVGGPHVSIFNRQVLETTNADFGVVGEGEYVLLELMQNLNLTDIRGLIWRQNSNIIINEKRPYITELDNLPFPAFYSFELDKYLCNMDKRLPMITSRGCPYSCIFCCTRLSMGRKFRARSPENVVNEIRHWHNKGWNNFDINDDLFTLDRLRTKKICELILEDNLNIQFNLSVGVRVDSVDEEVLINLKKAGCKFISYGCEAGNDRMLREIKKGITIEDVLNAVMLTKKVGINHKVNFIIGHPMERYEDAMDSIQLARILGSNYVGFNNMIPYPGTEAYDIIESNHNARFLCEPDKYLNDRTHKKIMPVFETSDFPIWQKEKALQDGFSLEEKTLARFRFGKYKGLLVYCLSRNVFISRVSSWLFATIVSTRVGYATYRLIVKSPW